MFTMLKRFKRFLRRKPNKKRLAEAQARIFEEPAESIDQDLLRRAISNIQAPTSPAESRKERSAAAVSSVSIDEALRRDIGAWYPTVMQVLNSDVASQSSLTVRQISPAKTEPDNLISQLEAHLELLAQRRRGIEERLQ